MTKKKNSLPKKGFYRPTNAYFLTLVTFDMLCGVGGSRTCLLARARERERRSTGRARGETRRRKAGEKKTKVRRNVTNMRIHLWLNQRRPIPSKDFHLLPDRRRGTEQ